tara:strand:+ start:9823 stop:9960 length:138 start_codon:yes stop_codon:yes gene_type:complete
MFESGIKYMHDNPVRSGFVEKQEDFVYSRARNYLAMKGLIEADYW